MKKFTKQEIIELYGRVTLGEISFSRMVEILNERVSDANEPQKRKFKVGDKVVLKSGYKKSDGLIYLDVFDLLIGKPLTIKGYTDVGNVCFSDCPYIFDEDWLEPYEELKEGDLAIFWDHDKEFAIIRRYYRLNKGVEYRRHQDIQGLYWDNAIKFESKDQYERLIKGEI